MKSIYLALHMIKYCLIIISLLSANAYSAPSLVIFQAKEIITMEPAWPKGKFVAVRDDRIVAVGRTMEDLKAWTDSHPYTIDKTFADKVLMPGFVESHIHVLLSALSLPAQFAAPDDWALPQGLVTGVKTKKAFLQRISEGDKKLKDANEWLFIFGYTQAYHKKVTRADLDQISTERPILVMSRSTHTAILNSKAIELAKLTQQDADKLGLNEFVNVSDGRFKEGGVTDVMLPKVGRWLMHPARIHQGLNLTKDMLHRNGVTTLHEPGTGVFTMGRPEKELEMVAPIFNHKNTPMRSYLSPRAEMIFDRFKGDKNQSVAFLNQLAKYNVDKVKFVPKRVKLYADGSFVDQIGMYNAPGYVDGHHGQMMTSKDKLSEFMQALWQENYAMHIHTQGDQGFKIAVDILQQLQNEKPRFNHGYTIDHINMASPEDIRKAARLGADASVMIWPLLSVGEIFSDKVLGADRTSTGFPLQTILDNNMTLALHADTPVSPPQPLALAWLVVNRKTASGRVLGEYERISVDDAMRAITINAARIIGMEDDIGSIRAGKKADFVVLEQSPYIVEPMKLKDIPIWGTVFEGKIYPVKAH